MAEPRHIRELQRDEILRVGKLTDGVRCLFHVFLGTFFLN